MTTFLIIIFGLIAALTITVLIVGMALKDIRQARMERDIRSHPHARKWRKRPTVHVLLGDEPAHTWLRHIRKTDYRKVTAATEETTIADGLLLKLPPHSSLLPGSLKEAVMQFNGQPSRRSFEMFPAITSLASSTLELFGHYHLILSAPLADMRNGLGLRVDLSPFPLLINPVANHKSSVPRLVIRVFHVMNLAFFTYAIYSAVLMTRPELLLLYLGLFSLWAAWSVIRYPALPFRLKILYLILFPTTLAYFVYRLVATPFRAVRLQASRQNAIIR